MYIGHLLIVPTDWLAAAFRSGDRVFAACRGDVARPATTGDPVFLLDDDEHVRAHTPVCGNQRMSLGAARANFGERLSVCGEATGLELYTPGPHSGALSVDVLYLRELTRIHPPLELSALRIAKPRPSILRKIEPEDVLTLLQNLPLAAQDDWTRRVVARNNDIPPSRRVGAAAG